MTSLIAEKTIRDVFCPAQDDIPSFIRILSLFIANFFFRFYNENRNIVIKQKKAKGGAF